MSACSNHKSEISASVGARAAAGAGVCPATTRVQVRRSRALDGLLCVRNYYGCTVPTTDRAVHRCDATAVTPIEVATPYHYQWQYGT